jgi:hypothetical protein
MSSIDFGLYFLYLLLGVALVVAIILPVVNLFSNPKSLIRIVIGAVVLIGLFFVAYSMSDGSVTPKWVALGQTESDIKLISAGIVMLYVFLFGSVLAMIYAEVAKLFK